MSIPLLCEHTPTWMQQVSEDSREHSQEWFTSQIQALYREYPQTPMPQALGSSLSLPVEIQGIRNNKKRIVATNSFFFRLASVLGTPTGVVGQLSLALGLHRNTLSSIMSQGTPMGARMAIRLESICGSDYKDQPLLPRSLTCPEMFA